MIKYHLENEGRPAIEYIATAKERVIAGIRTGMRQGMTGLAGYIVAQKLSGQVLNQRTGRLARAVLQSVRVWMTETAVRGVVNASPKELPNEGYWQEFGTKAIENEIMRMNLPGGYVFTRRRAAVEPRAFMNPSLHEYSGQVVNFINERIEAALR
jgi:hypothetical protein